MEETGMNVQGGMDSYGTFMSQWACGGQHQDDPHGTIYIQ